MSVLKGIHSHGGDLEVFKGSGHRWLSFCWNTSGDLQVTIAGRPSLTAVRTAHWSSQHLLQDRLPLMEMSGLLSDADFPSHGSPKSTFLPLILDNICPPRPSPISSTNQKQNGSYDLLPFFSSSQLLLHKLHQPAFSKGRSL